MFWIEGYFDSWEVEIIDIYCWYLDIDNYMIINMIVSNFVLFKIFYVVDINSGLLSNILKPMDTYCP